MNPLPNLIVSFVPQWYRKWQYRKEYSQNREERYVSALHNKNTINDNLRSFAAVFCSSEDLIMNFFTGKELPHAQRPVDASYADADDAWDVIVI